PRADPGPGQPRAPAATPAGAGGLAAVDQRGARGSAGQPQDDDPLAARVRAPVRDLPPVAVRHREGPRDQEGAEALPLGLVDRGRRRRALREHGGWAPAEVGPLATGHAGPGPGAALLP